MNKKQSRAGALADQLKDVAALMEKGVMPREMGTRLEQREACDKLEQTEKLRLAKARLRQFWED